MKKGTVLVTGGAKRIGKTICETLCERGWNVLIHSRDLSNPLCVEFSQHDAAEALFKKAVEIAPDLCAIVNNASLFSIADELSRAEEARLLHVNARVPLELGELLCAHLRMNGGIGAVVNIVDARVVDGNARTPYENSKFKLLDFSREQARLFAPQVRVNCVAPGPVLAPVDKANSEPGGKILLTARPTPQDVADSVAYLLEARAVTGQVIAVDSGQSLV